MNSIEIEKLTNDNIFDNKSDIDNFVSINIHKCKLGETINALYLQDDIIHDVSIERKTSSYKKREMLNPKDINVLHDPSNPRRNIIDRRDLEVVIVKFYIFKEDGGFYNELLHREDGPSLIYFSIVNGVRIEKYHILGQLHREDGPAIIRPNKKEWYINDKEISRFKYSMKFNRKYSHIDEINTLKEESKNRYKQFKEYKESFQYSNEEDLPEVRYDRYVTLKKYCDKFNNDLLNAIYDQHIIIQDHFNSNKDLDMKYLNQFDVYHTDILVSLLVKIDEKIKYEKNNLELRIKRSKSRIRNAKSRTLSYDPKTYKAIWNSVENGNDNIFDNKDKNELKALKKSLKNIENKYISELEYILSEYLDKLDKFEIDTKEVDIEYEMMLLKEVLKTDMLKI